MEGGTVGTKLGCSLAVLDGRAVPARLGRAVGFWLVGWVEVDGLSDEYGVGREVGKKLLVGLTVGLLEDDGAALGSPLRNRVGVLVGLLDVLGSIVWRIDCSLDGLFDATTEGKLLPSALGTDDCDTLGIPDGSMDAATVGGEVGFSVTLGTSEGIIEGLDETEGDTVGRGEGLWVILGTSEGIIEGLDEMEGDTVGSEEGCWLGTPEAVTEGLDDTEGDKDGFNVGDFEGIFVGYGVGGAGAVT